MICCVPCQVFVIHDPIVPTDQGRLLVIKNADGDGLSWNAWPTTKTPRPLPATALLQVWPCQPVGAVELVRGSTYEVMYSPLEP